jgi:TrmH family RNA methyltransferase
MKKLGDSRKYRAERGEFLCDGDKLLQEALKCGCEIVNVLTTDETFSSVGGAAINHVDDDLLAYVSPLKTPQSVLFTCKIPTDTVQPDPHGQNLLLDGIQDAGNIGGVLRTAAAFECGCVLLYGDTVDPYNPKAVRASMGAVFHQPFVTVGLPELYALKARGMRVYGAALDDTAVDFREAALDGACVAIGSEGRGLSREVLDLCDGRIIIPMSGAVQSLNASVAAAVVLWHIYSLKKL